MKQILMNAYGASSVLELTHSELPQPGEQELLMEVEAIGVNYSDILRRQNVYFMPTPLPYVLGAEVVGKVIGHGPGADSDAFPIGAKVLGILPSGGGYASHVCASQAYCVPLPPQMDTRKATAIFVQGSTAHLLANQVAGELKGKTILVHAASGGVGSLLVQLGKQAGARVIAASSSADKLTKAKALGADIGVNYSQPNWVDSLIERNGGEKVDLIFEMVGGNIYEQCIEALKPGGTLIVYGAASGEKGYIHSERFVDQNQHLRSFNLAHYIQHEPALWQQSLGAIIGMIASGELQVPTPNVFPLESAAEAHDAIAARRTTGKVVLIP